MGSDLRSPWSYGCNAMSSNQGGGQNQEIVELGSSYKMEKSLPNNSIISDGRAISSLSLPTNAFSGEDNSSSMLASLVVESNPIDSSSIDLKLGRLNDQANIRSCNSASVAKTNLYSLESTIPVKRARARGLGSQTPYCQVQGCKKDLSSCKYYHKRHRVCEIHSKTSIVIVNGIEQRFCQQCSRFHLLAEFDEGKRSCRRRLAGHNKRRRKPHIHPGREGALFHSCNTTTEKGNLIPAASFVSCNAFSSCWLRNEDKTVLDSSSTIGGLSLRTHISSSGCAPSLLSSQSQLSSTLTPVVPTVLPLVSSGSRALYGLTEPPQKFLDVSSQTPLSSAGRPTTNGIDRIIHQPANINSQNHFPFHLDHTIDLLQLSSQLQRVEDQRQYLMMKHDDDNFYGYKNP